jgi:hypothetical protein
LCARHSAAAIALASALPPQPLPLGSRGGLTRRPLDGGPARAARAAREERGSGGPPRNPARGRQEHDQQQEHQQEQREQQRGWHRAPAYTVTGSTRSVTEPGVMPPVYVYFTPWSQTQRYASETWVVVTILAMTLLPL